MGTFTITAIWQFSDGDIWEADNVCQAESATQAVADTINHIKDVWQGEVIAILVNATYEQKIALSVALNPRNLTQVF
jgi:hypothetical protein